MTLCIAWKQGNRLYIASDSRLCKHVNGHRTIVTNLAPKVYSIPVRVYSPSPEEKIIYDRDFGFCFAGGFIAGSSYADTISEILSGLQVVPGFSDYSFESISNIAFTVYEQYSKSLVESGQHFGLCEAFFTGICPKTSEMFLYKFSFVKEDVAFSYKREQIVLNRNEYALLGDEDAKNAFTRRTGEIKNDFTYLHLLSNVIEERSVSSIGGRVQCGYLDHNENRYFILCGILDHELLLNDDGCWQVQDIWGFRSMNLPTSLNKGDILIKRRLLTPFLNKRDTMIEEADQKNKGG